MNYFDDVWDDVVGRGRGASLSPKRRLSPKAFAEKYRGFDLPIPGFHEAWYDAGEAAILDPEAPKNLIILAPREHAKTSVVVLLCAWAIAHNRRIRIGIISGNDTLATARLREVQLLLQSPKIVQDYGNFRPSGKDTKWTSHEIIVEGASDLLGKDVSIFAFGAGSSITGSHCDFLIFDDIETTDTVLTPEHRLKTKRWFTTDAMNVLSPEGCAIVIGTRKHFDDLYGTLIDPRKDSGFVPLTQFRRCWLMDPETDEEILDREGHTVPIWPEKWSYRALQQRKALLESLDARSWPQEFLNLPLSGEDQKFQPQNWPTYLKLPSPAIRAIAVDLAIRKNQRLDRSAIAVGSIDVATNNVYLEYGIRGRWGFNETLDKLDEVARAWPPTVIGIEEHNYQLAAVEEFARRTMWPVKGVKADTDKDARLTLLSARSSQGKVYRPVQSTWWDLFVEEASTYPAGAFDDLLDAVGYLMTTLAEFSREVPVAAPIVVPVVSGGRSGFRFAP